MARPLVLANNNIDNNYIIDGNFQVAQVNPVVGTEITNPASGTYPVFDMWRLNYSYADGGTLPTVKHSQQLITSGSVPGSKYCCRVNVNGAGTSLGAVSGHVITHNIEHGTQNLCGLNKKVTLSFWARTSISGTKRIGILTNQDYGSGGSPSSGDYHTPVSITLSSSWQKFTTTITTTTLVGKTFGTNNDDRFKIDFFLMWGSAYVVNWGSAETFVGSGDIEIAQVKLEPGDTATTFLPRQFSEELRRCQRYYEKSYNYELVPGVSTFYCAPSYPTYTASGSNRFYIPYKVDKRISAQPTIYNPNTGTAGQMYNSGGTIAAGVAEYNRNGFTCWPNGTYNAGNDIRFQWVIDSRF